MPVLTFGLKETAAPWPPVRGGDMGLLPGAYPELEKQLPERTGHQMPSSSRMWKLGGGMGFKGKEWGQSPKAPYSVHTAVCRDPVTSPFGGESTGLVPESA